MSQSNREPYLLAEFKPRELEILCLIAEGLTNEEIAERLFIEVTTVRWHNRQIYSKLGVHHRTLAVAQARELGLLGPPDSATITPAVQSNTPLRNFPTDAAPIVGRTHEVAKACHLLKATRMLTLTGTGGIGKTQMAIQIARALADHFTDGIWFVPLAAIQDPDFVPVAIANVLGVIEAPGEALIDTLARHLRDQDVLLVIDNFEHVIAAITVLSTLLQKTNHLKIMVTSREVLRIYGEQEYSVPPLDIPDHEYALTTEALFDLDSVILFSQRVWNVNPDFKLNEENVATIAQICRRLDGLPLAIELAAALGKLLSPDRILSQLERGIGVLSRGPRDAPARQQTLRATIDWSYNLLSSDERILFARIAVFRGGGTLEAIESICSEGLSEDVFDTLAALIDKSLLRQEQGVGGDPRFLMLEMVRQYALELLDASAEGAQIQRLHAEYYAAFAERASPEIVGMQQFLWLNRVEAELDNIRVALAWALSAAGDVTVGMRISGSLGRFWYIRGHAAEGFRWIELHLARADHVPQHYLPAVFNAIGRLAREVNQESLGPVYHTHALEIARAIGDTPNIIMALSMSSSQMLGLQLIDYPTALAMLEEALSLSRATNDQKGLAAALNDLGEITRFAGELERAEAYYAEGAEVARASGNMYGANVGTANRGFVALKLSKYAEARTLFSSVLIQTRVVAGDMPSAVCLLGMAGVAVHEQQAERAAILLGAMQGILDAKRFYLHPNENVDFHDISAALHAQLSPAAYEAAWAQGYQMGPEKALIYALGSGSQ